MEVAKFHSSFPERVLPRGPLSSNQGDNKAATAAARMLPAPNAHSASSRASGRCPAVSFSLPAAASTPVTTTRDCIPPPNLSTFGNGAAESRVFACGSQAAMQPTAGRGSQRDCRFPQSSSHTPRLFCCKGGSVCPSLSCRSRRRCLLPLLPSAAVVLLCCLCCCSKAPPPLLFSPSPAAAQIVTYNGFQAPAPLSAVPQRGAFFLYEKGTRFYFPFFTSSSAGAAANKGRSGSTTITFKNLTFTQDSSAVVRSTLSPSGSASSSSADLERAGSALSGGDASRLGTSLQAPPVSPAGIEISLLPYEYTRTIFSAPSAAPFCCTAPSPPQLFVPTTQCPYPGALKRTVHASTASSAGDPAAGGEAKAGGASGADGTAAAVTPAGAAGETGDAAPDNAAAGTSVAAAQSASAPSSPGAPGGGSLSSSFSVVASPQYSQPVLLRSAGDGGSQEVTVEVTEGGIYFLVTSNCGGFAQLTFDGEVQVRNAYGFLPGHEYPKMPFYFIFMLVYLGVCFLWGFLLYRQRANLIAFHKCMLLVAVLGFLECLALFVYFSDFNLRGSRSSVLLVLSVLVSVVKNIFSYMLVLLGAIGWSITIPVLDRKTVVKMQIIVVLYIILDTARQVSDEFSHSHSLPLVLLLTCLFPISALNGLLFYWIISSINSNVEMLQQQKQHEKLLMYKRLYAVLLLAIFLAVIDLLCQIYVASWDASFPWKNQWWLSDAVPHFLFLLVLAAMMFIWRPNHQSKRLAYFTELGDADDLERAAGDSRNKNVWGEELDFHDHFSEDELEAGIPNFQLHSVGSMSDEGEFSDGGEQGHAGEMHGPELSKNGPQEEGEELRSTSSRAPTAASSSGRGRGPQQQQPQQRSTAAPASSPPAAAPAAGPTAKARTARAPGRGGAGAGGIEEGEVADDEEGISSSSTGTTRRGGGPVSPKGAVELSATPSHAPGSSKKGGADYH